MGGSVRAVPHGRGTERTSSAGKPWRRPPMITGLPWYVPTTILLVNITFFTFWMRNLPPALKRAGVRKPGTVVGWVAAILLAWMGLQAMLAARGFYVDHAATSPRFLLGIVPPLTAIGVLLAWSRSRQVVDEIALSPLTYLHTVRFFVELVVYSLFAYGQAPRLMTFLGKNPDILIGVTAPLVGYACFTRKVAPLKVALAWHAIGLALLANVSTLFIFSVPSPFQLFDVERPNVGFFYFPFIWAPTHGVPTVIFAHCIAIRTLTQTLRGRRAGDPGGPSVTHPYPVPMAGRNR
jgi:hypothetical protein